MQSEITVQSCCRDTPGALRPPATHSPSRVSPRWPESLRWMHCVSCYEREILSHLGCEFHVNHITDENFSPLWIIDCELKGRPRNVPQSLMMFYPLSESRVTGIFSHLWRFFTSLWNSCPEQSLRVPVWNPVWKCEISHTSISQALSLFWTQIKQSLKSL